MQLSVWKTDRMMRPIHIVSYDEQPGCSIRSCVIGFTETLPDGNISSTSVFYGVDVDGRTVLKWANDQGYTGIVQVGFLPAKGSSQHLTHPFFPTLMP